MEFGHFRRNFGQVEAEDLTRGAVQQRDEEQAAKEATPDARSATTPTTPQTPATAATTRERVVVDCFLEALRAAGVDPYPASVEVGIRDERAFIVTFYAHEWGSRATRTRNVRERERTGDARVRASGRMRRAAAIPTTNTNATKALARSTLVTPAKIDKNDGV